MAQSTTPPPPQHHVVVVPASWLDLNTQKAATQLQHAVAGALAQVLPATWPTESTLPLTLNCTLATQAAMRQVLHPLTQFTSVAKATEALTVAWPNSKPLHLVLITLDTSIAVHNTVFGDVHHVAFVTPQSLSSQNTKHMAPATTTWWRFADVLDATECEACGSDVIWHSLAAPSVPPTAAPPHFGRRT